MRVSRSWLEKNYFRQRGNVFNKVSTCLFVSRIMQKIFKKFSWNLVRLCNTAMGRIRPIFGLILLIMADWQPLWVCYKIFMWKAFNKSHISDRPTRSLVYQVMPIVNVDEKNDSNCWSCGGMYSSEGFLQWNCRSSSKLKDQQIH